MKPRVYRRAPNMWVIERANKIVGIYTTWDWAVRIALNMSRGWWFDNTSWGLYLELVSDVK